MRSLFYGNSSAFAEAGVPRGERPMPQHLIRKSDVSRLLQEPVTKSKKFPDGAGLYLEIRRQKNGDTLAVQLTPAADDQQPYRSPRSIAPAGRRFRGPA